MSHIIKQKQITMHNGAKYPSAYFNDEIMEFGIFELEMSKTEMTCKKQEINIMIDKSGSMDEGCEDGNSKMDQIKYVTNNILHYVATHCKADNVSMSVKSFNTRVEPIIDKTSVSTDNLSTLKNRVRMINPEDGTNVEHALKDMRDFEFSQLNVDNNNIFMSDGDANDGETRQEELVKLVDERATNYFIGFGLEHNPRLFSALSDAVNSSYYFVDKIEKSGTAYGEILHGILFRLLSNVKIEIENGFIYNWKTNDWRTEIFVGNMSGEMKRTFHILTSNKDAMRILVNGNVVNSCANLSEEIRITGETEDLTRMFYRQRTQEMLYKAKEFNNNDKMNRDEIRIMKNEMKAFIEEMMDYMKTNELTEDRLMKNLCDDIVIIHRTIGTEYGHMYSCSRQASQGTERLHTTTDTPKRQKISRCVPTTPYKNRRAVFDFCEDVEDDYDELDNHVMSQPCYTEEQAAVIDSISNNDEE